MAKNKHLTLEDRSTILGELDKGSSFKHIGELLGKDCTTISKEVRKHLRHEKSGATGKAFNDCRHSFEHSCTAKGICGKCFKRDSRPCWTCGRCMSSCVLYEKYPCPRLGRPPYVCNACPDRKRCSLEKALYSPTVAQREYESTKSEARSGLDISEEELRRLNAVVSPLLMRGQSIHHIALCHRDEIMVSERTLYTVVGMGLLDARNIDMPRAVRMRPRKKKPAAMKVDRACRVGRTYPDYQAFMEGHPYMAVRELDSVEGIRGGKAMLTIQFVESGLQLAFLRDANDSQSVTDIFERLYLKLRPEIFMKLFPVLLADNGSEFSNPRAIEFDRQGNRRTRMFYCDPNAPYQKPHCENNHEMIRRCIPKGTDLGRYSQAQISLMMSHINSYARDNFGDKSPYDMFAFQYGEEVLGTLGVRRIPPDEICLTPKIFKEA